LTGFGRPATDSQWIRKVKVKSNTTQKITTMPLMCQHCENPPCCDVCPTGASFKRVDGIVMVNQHTCIGCRYCMMACPFKARSFVHETLTQKIQMRQEVKVVLKVVIYVLTESIMGLKQLHVKMHVIMQDIRLLHLAT